MRKTNEKKTFALISPGAHQDGLISILLPYVGDEHLVLLE